MIWQITLSTESIDFLARQTKALRKRIESKIKWLAAFEQPQKLTKPLRGRYEGLHRLRIGDVRVIVEYRTNQIVIFVFNISFRGNAYN